MADKGILYVVATPIGNLGDISRRACEVLASVDTVVAEDTRHSGALLRHLAIQARLSALHEHNEREVVPGLVERLERGESLALISDAGTPLISDPGFRLVRAAGAAGITVSPLPGACAAIAALSVAGLASDRFVFEGFLPARARARRTRLEQLADETRSLIFYESSHRIDEMLADLVTVFGGDRQAVVARELTKLHETLLGGSVAQLVERVRDDPDQRRGEFVVVVAGAAEVAAGEQEGVRVARILAEELPPGQAATLAARISGVARSRLYRILCGREQDAE
jgi:16S rRNA (cytidine1402-2'-O)-methyltransferase